MARVEVAPVTSFDCGGGLSLKIIVSIKHCVSFTML